MRKLDEIITFAELERFINTPVKHYSSGMYVRLAFAVAVHLEPEILLVDEVLAVGDAQFRQKCLSKVEEVAQGGRTVLLVSHDMSNISKLWSAGALSEEWAITSRWWQSEDYRKLYSRPGQSHANAASTTARSLW